MPSIINFLNSQEQQTDTEVTLADYLAQEEDVAAQLEQVAKEGKRAYFTDTAEVSVPSNYAKVIVKPSPSSDLGTKAKVLTANSKPPITGDAVLDGARSLDTEIGTLQAAMDSYRADKIAPLDKQIQDTLTRLTKIGADLTKFAGHRALKRETAQLEAEREVLAIQAKVLSEQRKATLDALAEDPNLKDAERDLAGLLNSRQQLTLEEKERRAAQRAAEERAAIRAENLAAMPIEAQAELAVQAAGVDANYDAQTIAHFRAAYGRTPGEYVASEPLIPPAIKVAQIEAAKYFADTYGDTLPAPTQALVLPEDKLAFLNRAYQNKQTTQTGKVAMQQWVSMLGTAKNDPAIIATTAERLQQDPTLQAFNEALGQYVTDLKAPEAVRLQEAKNAWLREQAAKSVEMQASMHNLAAQFVAAQVGSDTQRYTDTIQAAVSQAKDPQKFEAFRVGAEWVAQKGATLSSWNVLVSDLAKTYRTPRNMRPAITDSPTVAAAYATEVAQWLWRVTEQRTEQTLSKSGYDPTEIWPVLAAGNSQVGWMERLGSALFTVVADTPTTMQQQVAPTAAAPQARPEYVQSFNEVLGKQATQPAQQARPEYVQSFNETLGKQPPQKARPEYLNSFDAILQGAQPGGPLERFLEMQQFNQENPWKAGQIDNTAGEAARAEKDNIMRQMSAIARDIRIPQAEKRAMLERLAERIAITEEN